MKDNYPILMQSEERNAPWNQKEPTPIDIDCCVSYCISKTMPVSVGSYEAIDGDNVNLENTNLIGEYNRDINAVGIPTLLCELRSLAKEKVERLKDEHHLTNNKTFKGKIEREIKYYESMIEASKGWTIDDLDVEKE